MKRILIVSLALFVFFTACKNSDKKKNDPRGVLGGNGNQTPTSIADSLYNAVIDEHDHGMSGWMKIEGRQKQIGQLIDSIKKLPAKAQSALASLKSKLDEVNTELGNAYKEMDEWMQEMNLDSANENPELRIKYLSAEKLKGGKITEMIYNSLQKADSLLQAKH